MKTVKLRPVCECTCEGYNETGDATRFYQYFAMRCTIIIEGCDIFEYFAILLEDPRVEGYLDPQRPFETESLDPVDCILGDYFRRVPFAQDDAIATEDKLFQLSRAEACKGPMPITRAWVVAQVAV